MSSNARQRRRAAERAVGRLESAEAKAHMLWVALRQLTPRLEGKLPKEDYARFKRALSDVESAKFRLQRLKADAEARLQKTGLHVFDSHKLRADAEA